MASHGAGAAFTKGFLAFFQQGMKVFWKSEEQPTRNEQGDMAKEEHSSDMASPLRRAKVHYEYMIPTLLSKAKTNSHLKLLDVGCGSGSITIELAKLIPEGQVTGVDISGAILESAKVHAEREGVSNINFLKADVHELLFLDGSFDVVCTHQAVAHFHDHAKAIRELVRVTRKGGMVCLREGDLTSARFSGGYGVLDECFQTIIRVHEGNGGTSDAGRRLKTWVEGAGVPGERIVATKRVWVYDTPERRREYGSLWPARCTQGVFAERAEKMGTTTERLGEYAVAWRKWIEDDGASFKMVHGEVIADV